MKHGTPEQSMDELIPELPGAVPHDEDPPLTPEARRAISYINAIKAPDKRRALAETDLEGRDGTTWLGLTRGLNSLESKHEKLNAELTALRSRKEALTQVNPSALEGEDAVRHSDELLRVTQEIARLEKTLRTKQQEIGTMVDQEGYATEVADVTSREIEANIDFAIRAWGDLPSELQDAILSENQATLRYYGVDSWSARMVSMEREKLAETERLLLQSHLGRSVSKIIEAKIPTGETLANSMDTPEFAQFSRDVILKVLDREGISAVDFPRALLELKSRYAKSVTSAQIEPSSSLPGNGVYEITDTGVVSAGTHEPIVVANGGPTNLDLAPRTYDSRTEAIPTSPLMSATSGAITYNRALDPEHEREAAALQSLLRAGQPKPVTMPVVPEVSPSPFTGVYVTTADGVVAVERKDDGTSFETPLPELHGRLGSVNDESPEERFRTMHGLTNEETSAPVADSPNPIHIPVVTTDEESVVPAEILTATETLIPAETPEVLSVVAPRTEVHEVAPTYVTKIKTERGALIALHPGMLFAEMGESDEANFAEALGGKDPALLLLMERDGASTRLIRDPKALTGGELYVGAYRGGVLLCHVPVTLSPTLGATLYEGGQFGGVIQEVVTPEMQAQEAEARVKREALDREREEAYRNAILAAQEREAQEEREARERREHEAELRRKAEEEHRAHMEALAREAEEEHLHVEAVENSPNTAVAPEEIPSEVVIEPNDVTPTIDPFAHALEEAANEGEKHGWIAPKEWALVPKEGEEILTQESTLDETGTLFASFLEREYGIQVDGAPAPTLVDSFFEMQDVTPSVIVSSEDTTPAQINHGVLRAFETKFDLLEDELSVLPVFKDLSPAKQLLVLRNLEQLTLTHVSSEAKATEAREWSSKRWWEKGIAQVMALGMKHEVRTKEIEQDLIAQARGKGLSRAEAKSKTSEKLSYVSALARVAKEGPDAIVLPDGSVRINMVSSRDLEVEGVLNPDTQMALEVFNVASDTYAKIPHEWRYSSTQLSPEEKLTYGNVTEAYTKARAILLDQYAQKFAREGADRPSDKAMIAMNAIDERVTLSQLFNSHPDAERALTEIEDASVWKSAAKEFWKTKGAFVAYGSLARAGAVSVAGVLALPTMGASLPALGVAVASYATAVIGAGYGVGNAIGAKEASRMMKDRRVSGRMTEEEEREEVDFDILKYGKPTGEVIRRKLKEFTDAYFFVDRIDRLTAKLDTATDPATRALIEKKIAQTTTLAAAKLRQGLINFGGSSLEAQDARRGDTIGSRLALMQAMHRGAMVTMVDQDKMAAQVSRMIAGRVEAIESKRTREMSMYAVKAGLIRAGFAATGAVLAQQFLPIGAASAPAGQVSLGSPEPLPEIAPNTPPTPNPNALGPDEEMLPNSPQSSSAPSTLPPVTPTPPPPAGSGMPPLSMPTPPIDTAPTRIPGAAPAPRPPQFSSGVAGTYTSPVDRGPTPMIGDPQRGLPQGTAPMPNRIPTPPEAPSPETPVPTGEADAGRVMRAIVEFRTHVGRSLSGTETITVRNLEQWGMKSSDAGDQALLGAVKRELAQLMKSKGAPLSSVELYQTLEKHGLEGKVAVPEDAELLAYRVGKQS